MTNKVLRGILRDISEAVIFALQVGLAMAIVIFLVGMSFYGTTKLMDWLG